MARTVSEVEPSSFEGIYLLPGEYGRDTGRLEKS